MTQKQNKMLLNIILLQSIIEKNYLADYGMSWLLAWRETNSFVLWNQYTDHEIYEIVEPG